MTTVDPTEFPAPEGDPRRCPRHPQVPTSSADGMFDAPCGVCETEMDADAHRPDFDTALSTFLAALTRREEAHTRANFKNLTPGSFEADPRGRKYVRIWHVYADRSQRSAYCFVERTTGKIYKPATWKAPTLNIVRGNIFNANPTEGTGVYGTNYAWDLK